jgi:hypothetical protein
MIESLKDMLSIWRTNTNDRVKLQHTYIIVAAALLLAAGLVGLMNYDMGQNLLMVAVISAGIFLANAVVWSLLQSAVLLRISARRTTTRKK